MKLSEYVDATARTGKVVWLDGQPWGYSKRVLSPLGPPHMWKPVNRGKVRAAMRSTRALVGLWNEGWDVAPCQWWWMSCDDREYDIAKFSKKVRYNIRLGLKHCEVRRVEVSWLGQKGYDVYLAWVRVHGAEGRPVSREEFSHFESSRIPGCETWGAFAGGQLVAYYICLPVEECVLFSAAKSDPRKHALHANNALVYTLTRHYLVERGFSYVTSGSRVVMHRTNVQEFYELMGHRRIYAPLRVQFNPLVRLLVASGISHWGWVFGLERLAPVLAAKIKGASRVARYAKGCEAVNVSSAPIEAVPVTTSCR